jgi:hypothetical protein
MMTPFLCLFGAAIQHLYRRFGHAPSRLNRELLQKRGRISSTRGYPPALLYNPPPAAKIRAVVGRDRWFLNDGSCVLFPLGAEGGPKQ